MLRSRVSPVANGPPGGLGSGGPRWHWVVWPGQRQVGRTAEGRG